MTPFVTLPHGFAMTRRLASSSPIGTISMSSVDFLRAAPPFQLPLFNFYERVSSIAEAEADAVSSMSRSAVESDFSSTFAMLIWRCT
jgi:hypothetical protein